MTTAGAGGQGMPHYDRIAHLYDADMARNMRYDDVGFYAGLCAAHGGRVLELGCGNGRILLALLARGIDVVGIDGSWRMLASLAEKAAARGAPVRVARMDVRRLAFGSRFDVVLCPYSLVTYMSGEGDAERMLAECASVLAPAGIVVVDAFVPRPIDPSGAWTRDYERAFGAGTLVRSKRVTPLAHGRNRLERRYEVRDAAGRVADVVETCEDIRPFAPEELVCVLERSGLRVRERFWNYASDVAPADAQFFTAVAAR